LAKLQTASELAKGHFAIDPSVRRVILLEPVKEDDPEVPIKLLEVVEGTIERGIEPVSFASDPANGVDYPVVIVEISPREFEEIAAESSQLREDLEKRGWWMGQELAV